MTEYYLRSATSEDEDAINSLYLQITGRRRTHEQYEWEWVNTSEGAGERWVICHRYSGRVVGHHGLIPIRMNINGETLLAGKTENTMVLKEHRKQFYYAGFEKIALKEARKKFQILFTTAGRGAPGLMRRRMGYQIVGQWITFAISASAEYLSYRAHSMKCMIHLMSGLYLRGRRLCVGRARGLRAEKVYDLLGRSDQLGVFWEENRGCFGLTPMRTKAYLDWRFGKNPYCKYHFYLFEEGGELQGFMIAREGVLEGSGRKYRRLIIEDAVAKKNSGDLYERFLGSVWDEFAGYDLVTVRTLYMENELNRALGRLDLYPWRRKKTQAVRNSPFYAYYAQPELRQHPWFITEILTEGVG